MSSFEQRNGNEKRARAWRLFLPPARPSRGEAALYEKAVLTERKRKGDHPSCLLLGSTPEIRSLAHRLGLGLRCVDRDSVVFEVLGDLVEPKGPEAFERSNWLDMSLVPRAEIVFADGSMNMLPVPFHARFLRILHEVLEPGGLAALRVHLLAPPRFVQAAEVFAWYRREGGGRPVFSATRTHLDMLWVDPTTQGVDFVRYHERIRELRAAGGMNEEEFQAYDRLLEFNRIVLYYAGREEFEGSLSGLFEIVGVERGGDYACDEQHPLYLLRKAG